MIDDLLFEEVLSSGIQVDDDIRRKSLVNIALQRKVSKYAANLVESIINENQS